MLANNDNENKTNKAKHSRKTNYLL